MQQQLFLQFKGISPEELQYLEQLTKDFTEQQIKNFVMLYTNKRKDPQDILLFTLLGFVGVSGVQRFVTGQMGLGILYLFTAGLCLIGTLVDLINHKSLAQEYNQRIALDCAKMARMFN